MGVVAGIEGRCGIWLPVVIASRSIAAVGKHEFSLPTTESFRLVDSRQSDLVLSVKSELLAYVLHAGMRVGADFRLGNLAILVGVDDVKFTCCAAILSRLLRA